MMTETRRRGGCESQRIGSHGLLLRHEQVPSDLVTQTLKDSQVTTTLVSEPSACTLVHCRTSLQQQLGTATMARVTGRHCRQVWLHKPNINGVVMHIVPNIQTPNKLRSTLRSSSAESSYQWLQSPEPG